MNIYMSQFLEIVNQYANLILIGANVLLVIVTMVYVYFTAQTVREMRRAREGQLEAHMVATIEPLGSGHAKLCVRNVGGGPALDIAIGLSVRPRIDRFEKTWTHPATWPGQAEYFLLPHDRKDGQIPTLAELVDIYEELDVCIKWRCLARKATQQSYVFNLKSQMEGWYNAGNLRPEQTIGESLVKVATSLGQVDKHIKGVNSALQELCQLMASREDAASEEDIAA